jgi:hypothetical protein
MGAEVRFQLGNIDGSHVAIISNVTMLVICYFLSSMLNAHLLHLRYIERLEIPDTWRAERTENI